MHFIGDRYALESFSRQSSYLLPVLYSTLKYIINGESWILLKAYINVRSLNSLRGNQETPKKGYKSITVKAEVYGYFFSEWLKVKEEYAIQKGIRSFSAYVTYRLAQLMAEDKKRIK